MKFTVIQPRYSMEYNKVDECYSELINLLSECDESMDVIVLPEYSNVPANVASKAEFDSYIEKNHENLISEVIKTAKRCSATVFVNSSYKTDAGYRNTTFAFSRDGKEIGKYFKVHPAPSEVKRENEGGYALDVGYSYDFTEPYVVEIDGVRYGFLTCYDFYFYEYFARLARANLDVIIGTSLQRTDTHEALEIIGRFLSYNTNSYLVRSSVSLGADSLVCGSSMIVSPKGEMLVNMKNGVGIASYEFNPKDKYYKPAGFGGKPKAHYEYVEEGRRPFNYRPGGSSICNSEKNMPYPRICAHRGFSKVAPENSMPAFGAAVALGACEIELDLWPTKDGEIVSIHDSTLERISTGVGLVYEKTYEELKKLDFGVKFGEEFAGLKIVRFEDVLKKFSCHTVMNIHVKNFDDGKPYPKEYLEKIVSLIRKYDAQGHCYFMVSPDIYVMQFKEYAPDIPVCVGHLDERPYEIVDRAIAMGAEKVQLFKPYFNKEMIEKAHKHGIRCNVFYADDLDEAREYLDMGVDTVLTNDYLKISTLLNE